jgi:hypothetical protein
MMAGMTTPTPVPCPAGQYRFLPAIEPFSAGVVAMAGHEIVHATLQTPLPWRDGFALIDAHLRAAVRPRAALCAIELRIPGPFSFEGFDEFNRPYRALLERWDLLVDGVNPVARTNVAPVVGAPAEPSLYAFSYTAPSGDAGPPTFVVAGSGDVRGRTAADIVRRGETSAAALAEKAAFVMAIQSERLAGLGSTWAQVTAVDIYTPHPISGFLERGLLDVMGPAALHGVHWYLSRPPIEGLEYEMDMRGVRREVRLGR